MRNKLNQSDSQSFLDSISSKFSNIVNEFDTLKINVEASEWTETMSILKNELKITSNNAIKSKNKPPYKYVVIFSLSGFKKFNLFIIFL